MNYQVRVAGVTADGRQQILEALPQNQKIEFKLKREPENPYDKNAIAVYLADSLKKVGYIPRGHVISEKMKNNIPFSASGIVVGGVDGMNYGIILNCKSSEDNEEFEIANLK